MHQSSLHPSLHRVGMPFRVLLTPILSMVMLIGCSEHNDQGVAAPESPQATAIDGETLLLQPPPAWLRGRERNTENFRIVDFFPAGNNQADWYEKLTVESNSLTPLPDPIDFLNQLGDEQKDLCKTSDHQNIATALENGYQTSVRLLICDENKETGRTSVTFIKAILGKEHFYNISHTKRSEPLATGRSPITKEEIAKWSLYMRSIKLCDSRDSAHRCPTTS